MTCVAARAKVPRPRGPAGDRAVLAGAASAGLRPTLDGPASGGRVLATFPSAVYIEVRAPAGPHVVALVTTRAVQLPNAVLVTAPSSRTALASIRVGDPAVVGDGSVSAGAVCVRVRRWWNPTPTLGRVPPAQLERGISAMRAVADRSPRRHGLRGHQGPEDLADACVAGDLARAVDVAERLVGLGPGLTPSGDDMLAGLLVALRAMGAALPAGGRATWFADWLGVAVTSDARTRTTTLAATLLGCAARGECSVEMAAVLHAVAGTEPVEPALARLLATGHTSGADLAWGLLTGCTAALRRGVPAREPAREPA